MKVAEAIEVMVSTYGDLDTVARGLPVDAAELYAFEAEADTAEAVAVACLKKYNAAPIKVTVKESK